MSLIIKSADKLHSRMSQTRIIHSYFQEIFSLKISFSRNILNGCFIFVKFSLFQSSALTFRSYTMKKNADSQYPLYKL